MSIFDRFSDRNKAVVFVQKTIEEQQRDYKDLFSTNGHGVKMSTNGKPKQKRMYQAAMTNRLVADWIISVTSANAEILVSKMAVVSRCRQVARDNPYAKRIITLEQNNVIGHDGIQLQMKITGADGKLDRVACQIVKDSWAKWSRKENCTVSKTQSLNEVLRKAVAAGFIRDGGILYRKHRGFNNAFKFAIEEIEIDRLDFNYNVPHGATGTNKVQFGIEYDYYDAPMFYNILTRHPGDIFAYSPSPKYRIRVPQDEIIPFWEVERAGQMVGMPRLSPALFRLNMLDKYDQAEVIAAFIASCKGGVLERTMEGDEYLGDGEDERGNVISNFEPGQVEELPYGLSYKPIDPSHPTDAYPDFVKTQLRAIASGAGVSYTSLANDLENVNFSSIRAGIFEEREQYMTDQELVIENLLTPLFEEWLMFAIISGQIPYSMADYDRLNNPCWRPRRWAWVNPLQEVQANILAIRSGLTSPQDVLADEGKNMDETYDEIADAKAMQEEKGLEFDYGDKVQPEAEPDDTKPPPKS